MIRTKVNILITLGLLAFLLTFPSICSAAEWEPIAGIPEPPQSLTRTHHIYEGRTFDYAGDGGVQEYRMGPDGPYTHYIDPLHPNAADTSNPYGTAAKPRKTFRNFNTLAPGSVVELYNVSLKPYTFTVSGTADSPIFIRGSSTGAKPVWEPPLIFQGPVSHLFFENIDFDLNQLNRFVFDFAWNGNLYSHIVLRNSEIHNLQTIPLNGRVLVYVGFKTGEGSISNVLIAGNHFHHLGEGRAGGRRDVTAIFAGPNSKNVWILDNHFHHIGGDGVQCNMDNAVDDATPPNHIYIGRNTFHDLWENAVDLKMCEDVIVSRNIAYNFGPEYSAVGGDGSPFRYGPGEGVPTGLYRNNIWTIFNEVYDTNSSQGCFLSYGTDGEEPADETYYIGNLIRDVKSAGFNWWNQKRIYFINNTIQTLKSGFSGAGEKYGWRWTDFGGVPERITIANNIIYVEGARFINLYAIQDSLDRMIARNNIYYDPDATADFRWGISDEVSVKYSEYSYSLFLTTYPEKLAHSKNANPQFVDSLNDDFRLAANSPAIDAGNLEACYDTFYGRYGMKINVDFAGSSVPDHITDIGAFERNIPPAGPSNLRWLNE